jgi:cytochrome c oxidase subunit 2
VIAGAGAGGGVWLPAGASTSAPAVDALFHFIFGVAVVFFALIVGLMVYFVVRFRRRGSDVVEPSPAHNTALELAWSGIPLLLVIAIFAWGFKVYLDLATPPANAYEVQVTGQKWKWLFTYPNGHVDESLHVPVDRPVKLVMTSEDVIHSFFVPAFRVKRDVVPGRYSSLWFEATRTGNFPVLCAEYCGRGHSDMLAEVVVHPPGGFERWLEDAANFANRMSPAEAGERLFRTRGCAQCHSVDGSAKVGPSLAGVVGRPAVLRDGTTVVADENYVRESILEPQAKVAAGFEPVMPTYKGRLKDEEITALIAYLKAVGQEAGSGKGEGSN